MGGCLRDHWGGPSPWGPLEAASPAGGSSWAQCSLEAGEAFPGESPLDAPESQMQMPDGARPVGSAGAVGQKPGAWATKAMGGRPRQAGRPRGAGLSGGGRVRPAHHQLLSLS